MHGTRSLAQKKGRLFKPPFPATSENNSQEV
jgi:hypothetical protein